ncbi:acyl carrier protein [Yoonia sp. 208BN28-4]|uniref:acyl carrier protein n=1 Tax=Yoonia sp. 208BN28-4 TaxID=3126505 RepID=UPI0030968B60
MNDHIATRTRTIIANALDATPDQLTDDTHLFNDLNADSLDAVEIAMDIEEAFGIEITDAKAETMQTVGKTIAVIRDALGEAAT